MTHERAGKPHKHKLIVSYMFFYFSIYSFNSILNENPSNYGNALCSEKCVIADDNSWHLAHMAFLVNTDPLTSSAHQ